MDYQDASTRRLVLTRVIIVLALLIVFSVALALAQLAEGEVRGSRFGFSLAAFATAGLALMVWLRSRIGRLARMNDERSP